MPIPIDLAQSREFAAFATKSPLLSCVFDPTGRFLLAGGRAREVVCVDVDASSMTLLEGHDSWVVAAVRAGEELIITADQSGRLIAWECGGELPRTRWSISAHAVAINSLAVNPQGDLLATGDRDGMIRVWRTRDGAAVREWPGQGFPATALVFHPAGRQLVSADRQPKKPRLHWWDIESDNSLRQLEIPGLSAYRRVEDIEWGGVRGLALSRDGKTIAALGENDYSGPASVMLVDFDSPQVLRKLNSPLKGFYYRAAFRHASFSPASSAADAHVEESTASSSSSVPAQPTGSPTEPLLFTAGGDVGKGELRLWNWTEENQSSALNTPGPCMAFDLHPDGIRFAVALAIGKGSYPDSGQIVLRAWPHG